MPTRSVRRRRLGTKLETVTTKVDNLVAAGGEANILEGVKVNGAALAISDKMVDILIASGEENGTISVNGAAVAIKGLAALATSPRSPRTSWARP